MENAFGSNEFRQMLYSAIEMYYKDDDYRLHLFRWNQLDLFLTKYDFDNFFNNYDISMQEYKTFLKPTVKLIDSKLHKRVKKAIKNNENLEIHVNRYPFSVDIIEGDNYES